MDVAHQKQASNIQQQHKAAQHPFQKPSPFDLVSTRTWSSWLPTSDDFGDNRQVVVPSKAVEGPYRMLLIECEALLELSVGQD
ncbi:hypothetical protein M0R45_005125 [Rubus argutus]|uniref:Uncharacterized protein n=1 Tax=Rubus argutus TaxID=59490 RepID=A0AAW1YLQ1_RUBAR